jgi:hypothetical protein
MKWADERAGILGRVLDAFNPRPSRRQLGQPREYSKLKLPEPGGGGSMTQLLAEAEGICCSARSSTPC